MIVGVLDGYPRRFWRRHPAFTGMAALLAAWLLVEGWYVTVGVTAAIVVVLTVRRTRLLRRVRHRALRAHADFEHHMLLAGDQRGTFGRYPPVQPGWFPDPQNRWQWRYFDGAHWTGYAVRP